MILDTLENIDLTKDDYKDEFVSLIKKMKRMIKYDWLYNCGQLYEMKYKKAVIYTAFFPDMLYRFYFVGYHYTIIYQIADFSG